jgi:PPOX class probable F420-dependent enzyme
VPKRRDQIRMSEEEIARFLEKPHSMTVATLLPGGMPHLVQMFYGFFPNGALGIWTYAKSQKVKNLERDPRIACLVEEGYKYEEIKAVYLAGVAEIHSDQESVLALGRSLFERYWSSPQHPAPADLEYLARKRVAIEIKPSKVVSWDHSKLGGRY